MMRTENFRALCKRNPDMKDLFVYISADILLHKRRTLTMKIKITFFNIMINSQIFTS